MIDEKALIVALDYANLTNNNLRSIIEAYEAAKAEADFDANYRRAAQGKDVGGVGRQVDKQVIEAAKASERPESPKRIVRKDGEIIGIEPNPYHQPVECAGAFQKDYSAYVKQWSDGECPVTAAERDAYAAGWKDAWQHKRELITPKKDVDTCED